MFSCACVCVAHLLVFEFASDARLCFLSCLCVGVGVCVHVAAMRCCDSLLLCVVDAVGVAVGVAVVAVGSVCLCDACCLPCAASCLLLLLLYVRCELTCGV